MDALLNKVPSAGVIKHVLFSTFIIIRIFESRVSSGNLRLELTLRRKFNISRTKFRISYVSICTYCCERVNISNIPTPIPSFLSESIRSRKSRAKVYFQYCENAIRGRESKEFILIKKFRAFANRSFFMPAIVRQCKLVCLRIHFVLQTFFSSFCIFGNFHSIF